MADPAVQVAVAQGVADVLTGGTFSQPFELERSYAENDQELQLGEPRTTRVLVVAVTTEQVADPSSRGTLRFDVPIDVAVLHKFASGDQAEDSGRLLVAKVDGLVLLVEQFHKALTMLRLPTFESAVWQSTKILANPIKQHLREWRQFTGIVRVTFRADVSATE